MVMINMENKEKKLEGKIIYDGKVVKLSLDKVLVPNGKEAYREIVNHNGGAAILCLNNCNEVLLIKQFRYAYAETIYEIPAGKLEKGEDPLTAAYREFEEETGYQANRLDYLGVIYPTCGYSNEKIYLYLALDFKVSHPHFDEDEFIEAEFIDLNQVLDMIQDGTIKDAKTICAINYYLLKKGAVKKLKSF